MFFDVPRRGIGNGIDNPTFINAMAPAFWHKEERFQRIGEVDGGVVVGRGGFGKVFAGYDHLRQENVYIKRQSTRHASAARELACYNMLQAFPHPNILRMHGMWNAKFQKKEYLYIAMEACHTTLWKYIGVDNPDRRDTFHVANPPDMLLSVVRAVGHLHGLGIVHGGVSLSNILVTAASDVRLADFGTVTAHTYLTNDKLCVAYIRPPETTLGSSQKGPAVDSWAVALVALAMWTGKMPTYEDNSWPDDQSGTNTSKQFG